MIKFIICRGIGFSPGTISYIPTAGFSIAEPVPTTLQPLNNNAFFIVLGG